MITRGTKSPSAQSPFLDTLSASTRTFLQAGLEINFPPPGYDPLQASDDSLEAHFLPPRPDPTQEPQAFALWEQAMAGPLTWPTQPDDDTLLDALFRETTLRSHSRLSGPAGALFDADSSNWSGAYVRPPEFTHMTTVYGLWTVPDPVPPGPQAGEYASSTWIGLDGYDPASRSLPQIGSAQWVTADGAGTVKKVFYTWWEWFVRDAVHNRHFSFRNFPIAAGDVLYAQVYAIGTMAAGLCIINTTAKAGFPFRFRYKSPIQPPTSPTNPLVAHVERRTAEWIVERPAYVDSELPYILANYGNDIFKVCLAGTDAFQELDLERAHLIRMIDWESPPVPSTAISTPTRNSTVSMTLRYGS